MDKVLGTHLEYPILCRAEICDTIDKEKLAAAGIEDVDADLMPVKFKLVHANTNKNKDTFTEAELQSAEKTPTHKPIDWQHTDRIIGVMVGSEYKEGATDEASGETVEDPYLEIDGVIYKYKFPAYAAEMKQRHDDGELLFSMEVWFEEAECSVCGESFANSADYCEHLKGRMLEGSTANRILKGLTFGGAGVVDRPADEEAESVSLGAENKEEDKSKEDEDMPKANEGQIVFDSDKELAEYVKVEVDKALDKVKSEADYKTLEAELTEANTKISDLEKTLEEKDAEIAKAEEKINSVQAEFDKFKEELEKDKQVEARVSELIEAGIKFPEDEEKKEKIVASLRNMSDEEYAQYKELIVMTAEAKKEEAKEKDEDKPEVDVPNPSIASEKFSTLKTILDKTSKYEKAE